MKEITSLSQFDNNMLVKGHPRLLLSNLAEFSIKNSDVCFGFVLMSICLTQETGGLKKLTPAMPKKK